MAKAISHKGSKETGTTVKINNSTGDLECEQNANELCERLGLEGDGIGQEVGVRAHSILFGTCIAFCSTKIVLKGLNPPEATIAVTGTEYKNNESRTVTRDLDVAVDDLVPLESHKGCAVKVGPLLTGYQPHMPRAPAFDHDEGAKALLLCAAKYLVQVLASASVVNNEGAVEVVYIPATGRKAVESGQGFFQVRAKKNIT